MTSPDRWDGPPAWARRWLIAAGLYNVVWGAIVVAFPALVFDLTGMQQPVYPQIWQCVGMIVGVYGIGYLAASRDSRRHWPIVLVGLLGKVFGPIGFGAALIRGEFPLAFGATLVTNDLVWWVPFSMMLWDAARANSAPMTPRTRSAEEAMEEATDLEGRTLRSLSEGTDLLVVFTRHSGCTFCKQMLADLARHERAIRKGGYAIAVVSMSPRATLRGTAAASGLEQAAWISDPAGDLYRGFGLGRGRFRQLFGLQEWWRGLIATLRGHTVGRLVGDGFQMPGVFIVRDGRIVAAEPFAKASTRLDETRAICAIEHG